MERMLIATTPKGMEVAHDSMIGWCRDKYGEAEAEVHVYREELRIAEEAGWETGTIKRRLKREGERMIFYTKIRKALEAGYYVVPNFLGDAFAIRTDAKKPRRAVTYHYVGGDEFSQPSKRLPAGEGRYIAPRASHRQHGTEPDPNRKDDATRKVFKPADLEPVDFPVALMVPQVMDATARAMADKVFDEMLQARDWASCGDPMVLGRIRNPRPGHPDVTFFIASVMPLDRI